MDTQTSPFFLSWLCYTIKIHDKSLHRCNWQQGDIYYKPKTWFKNCDFWNWNFMGYKFLYWWWGSFTIFFGWVVGVKNMCIQTPPPPTFNSGTALSTFFFVVSVLTFTSEYFWFLRYNNQVILHRMIKEERLWII